jgi:Tol biopolymer transport system component
MAAAAICAGALVVGATTGTGAGAAAELGDGNIANTRFRPAQNSYVIRSLDPVTGTSRWMASGTSPAWSPNGRRLAFITLSNRLAIRNADGSVTRTRVPAYGAHMYTGAGLAWSPDGTRLAFTYREQVRVMSSSPPYGPHQVSPGAGYGPSWSPDSSRVIYTGYDDNTVLDLRIVNADGTGDVDVTDTPAVEEAFPDWSPDGASLAFFASPPDAAPQGVYVSDSNGDAAHFVVGTHQVGADPEWSPSGSRIAFIGDTGPTVVNADGINPRVLTGRNTLQPAWQAVP